jgi:uncharacterized membrane protein YphA (DoxX/SURF4 family)
VNKKNIVEYLIAFTRIYLAVVFILSGLDKINDLASFAQSIENYRILPLSLVNIIAIFVPWIELVAGGLLLLGFYIKENSTLILALLIIFTAAIISAVLRDLDIDCGCQGTFDGQKVGILKIIENSALMIVSFLSIRYPRQLLVFIKNKQ